MRRTLILFLCSLCAPLLGQTPPRPTHKPLAFTHVTVIDVDGGPTLTDRTVLVIDNRIAAVGPAGKVDRPKDTLVVDASGKFLTPGLWDMHVHWYDKDYLPLFLANGVTGIRMMWGAPLHYQFRKGIEAGNLIGPRIVIASAIIDGPASFWPGSVTVRTAEEARLAVDRERRAGADFIKVYSFLPRDAFFAIADESKKLGVPFAGHVPEAVSVEEASDAGQISMEHLIGILEACSTREKELLEAAQADLADAITSGKVAFDSPRMHQLREVPLDTYDPDRAAKLFARFKKNGTWQCPTLTVNRTLGYLDDPAFRDDPRLKYMPRSIRTSWTPDAYRVMAGKKAEDYAYERRAFQKDLELVGAMNRAGVDIIAGTDVLNAYCFPGFSLPDELELYVKAGLSPAEALRTATSNPARFLGREKELGTVESGKLADLVLLDANPLDNINNVRRISAVVFNGNYYPRKKLDTILSGIEGMASRKSIGEALFHTIKSDGLDAAVKQYYDLKKNQAGAYDFGEDELNTLGYQLVGAKKFKEAIRVLQLNVEANPLSSNVYDSLAEAYMDNGDKELAIESYKKSLQLDPANKNAADMLKKLTAP